MNCKFSLAMVVIAAMTIDIAAESITALQQRSDALQQRAAKMEKRDPDFFAWIKWQQQVFASIKRNIDTDLKDNQGRADSETGDWSYLLDRLEAECAFAESAPDLDAGTALDVRKFGAKADGTHDDAPAIRQAIAAAVKDGVHRVFLPEGRYLINPPPKEMVVFNLDKIKNLLLVGEPGTELICPDPMNMPFVLNRCQNVRLKNLKFSFAKRGYVSGTIVKVTDPATLEVAIDPGMPSPEAPYFKSDGFKGLCRFYSAATSPETGRPLASNVVSHAIAPDVKHLRGNTYAFTLKDVIPVRKFYKAGMHIVYYARGYGNHCVINQYSDRTRLDNLEITGSGAMAFLNDGGNAMFITNCRVVPLKGSYVTTAADGFFCRDNTLGGYIANNEIKYIGDDFLNNHNTLRPCVRQDGNILYFPQWFHGEVIDQARRLGWIRTSIGEAGIAREVKIVKLETVKAFPVGCGYPEFIKVTCDQALPPVATLENTKAQGHQVADMFTILENQCHGQIMVNNRFIDGFSRFLIGGRNWIFANNQVDDSLAHPYLMNIGQEVGPGWMGGESFQPRNVIFRDNVFNCPNKSVFSFAGGFDKSGDTQRMAHFTFAGNHINLRGESAAPVFAVSGVEQLAATNNTIIAYGLIKAPVFDLKNSSDITITDNRIKGNFTGLCRSGENVHNVTVKNNQLAK